MHFLGSRLFSRRKRSYPQSEEHKRLLIDSKGAAYWKRWGPYVSERAWGTVREDYSSNGDPWSFFPHDHARSKACRWGEDGLAAICDRYQLLVFGLALWNGNDPILKERLFGLVPTEGNHGEDVKEYYFYLDSTPTHSYMKYLYKYPQAEFPYTELVEENKRRAGAGLEYELLDSGVFDENRYFDVFVEYAKASPDDIVIKIEAFNRGPVAAPLHIIPQLWFRNTWSWGPSPQSAPSIVYGPRTTNFSSLVADDSGAKMLDNLPFEYSLGKFSLYCPLEGELLFTNNETNRERLYSCENTTPYVKDAFHRYIINGEQCVNPARYGTKGCYWARFDIPAGASRTVYLRLSDQKLVDPLGEAPAILERRRAEADKFYEKVHPPRAREEEKKVQRQALAGMLWTKQIYLYDVDRWLKGDNPDAPPAENRNYIRNHHWRHLNSMRVLSMPDKWEYPWFAAWDLAFHTVALALVDPELAKEQLWLMLFEQFQHPNGQIPAYEWEFSDLNPPVQAWATWRLYNMEAAKFGSPDREFLEKCFHKLLINFAWWINKVDSQGNNVFEGGFLGLDNITVLDRSEKLPGGAVLEQSDATGWMGFFCLTMMRMALELAKENKVYESMATKFFQHYIYVGAAMKHMGGRDYSLWDEEDGFFYDVLRYPDGNFHKFRVRSLVGIIPIYAVERLEQAWIEPFTDFKKRLDWFIKNRQDIVQRCCYTIERKGEPVHVLTIFDESQLKRLLQRVLDPNEFLSDFGIRSLSKVHEHNPFVFGNSEVRYEPAESNCKIKGGNSNWRGPIWFPTSFLIIESLRKLAKAYGSSFKVPAPDGGGREITLAEMTEDLANRMINIFLPDKNGTRPVYGRIQKFQDDPHWRDYILFYEYFHGDNGAGLGASHQTGWTGLVANLIDEWRR
ncbi:MAG: glucosidase [Deltaproteobacteria bacterium]|nr:glucosidase [Deltaproteobacteria bacterium]